MTDVLYDAARGGAIWNRQMADGHGETVAVNMVHALREAVTGTLPEGCSGYQDRTFDLSYEFDQGDPPTPGDVLFFATGSNVLIEMRKDFRAQVAEARERGESVPNLRVGAVSA